MSDNELFAKLSALYKSNTLKGDDKGDDGVPLVATTTTEPTTENSPAEGGGEGEPN